MNEASQGHAETFPNQASHIAVRKKALWEITLRPAQDLAMSHSTQDRIVLVRIKHRALQNCWQASSVRGQPLDTLGAIDPRTADELVIAHPPVLLHGPQMPPSNINDLPHARAILQPPQLLALHLDPRRHSLTEAQFRAGVPRALLPLRVLFGGVGSLLD